MRRQGHQAFVGELARFAARGADRRLTAIAERAAAPLRVAVHGRRGVGCSVVARALNHAAIASVISAQPDLVVYVIAEVVKPEDSRAIRAAQRPVLAVLNKADVAGFAGDGPMALARARCKHFSALLRVPVEPMMGLLAVAAQEDVLDDASWAALRTLAADASATSVPADVRLGLLNTLGLFGVAVAVAALRQGKTAAQVRALLRRASGVDAVLDRVAAVGAEVRYRRVLDAVAELEALAVSDGEIGGFLARDDTVIARMAAAVDLAESAGLQVGSCHDSAAHLAEAVRWQRYGLGPVSDVHRACGADIARGSLRLWSRAGVESP
ncbi:hypothetical protein [Mycobacterium sp.]|uniref:hypothetical protein n=1 Tax=Mycobacterium sp. TaxID=1785 RepID=UPI003F947D23